MAQRVEPKDSADDFPTPPWATRALVEHVLRKPGELPTMTCLEPACGAGHMAKVLTKYFGAVHCSDAYPYGYGHVRDFLTCPYEDCSFDWVITHPPFRLAMPFILRALLLLAAELPFWLGQSSWKAWAAIREFFGSSLPRNLRNSRNVCRCCGDDWIERQPQRQAMRGLSGKRTLLVHHV